AGPGVVDTGKPAAQELLDGGHVDHPVVQVFVDAFHVTCEEGPVRGDGVAAQRGLAGFAYVLADVLQDGVLGLGQGQTLVELLEQTGSGVHVAHEVAHGVESFLRRLDHHIDTLVEDVELFVGDQTGDLDERVTFEVQAGHLAVDPHQAVVHTGQFKGIEEPGRSKRGSCHMARPGRCRCCPWVSIPDELARDSDAEDLVDPVVDTPDLEVGQNEHDKDDHGERRAPTTAAAPLLPWLVGLLGAGIVLLVGSATGVVGAVGAPRWLLGATGRWRSTGATHVGWETTRLACEPGRWGSTRPHRVAGVALWMVSVRARGRAEAAGRWWAAVVPGGRVT